MDVDEFSRNLLDGEPLPHDLERLFRNRDELELSTELIMGLEAGWDSVAYFSGAELADPEIAANVTAMKRVCDNISFVAGNSTGDYYGYWRGPDQKRIAESNIVMLDSEGQFHVCGGRNLADAIIDGHSFDQESFISLKSWMQSIEINVPYNSPAEINLNNEKLSPQQMRERIYNDEITKIVKRRRKSWYRFW